MVSRMKEKFVRSVFFFTAFFAVIVVAFILLFLFRDGYPIFETVGVLNFLFGPTGLRPQVVPSYGISALIVGTLLVTLGAMVFAVPLSIGCAIYISELASPRVKKRPQAGHRTACRDPFGRLRVLRPDRPDQLHPDHVQHPHRADLACRVGPSWDHGTSHDHQRLRGCHQFGSL